MDIAEFLLAREDDREKAAIRTTGYNPGPWTARRGMVKGRVIRSNEHIDGDLWENEGHDRLSMEPATAEHVAGHDPTFVLIDIAAKREIIADCVRDFSDETACDLAWRTLRRLAATHAGHPDFDEEWRIEATQEHLIDGPWISTSPDR